MTALPEADLRRVVATAGLLCSQVDGEALGATRALCRVLGKHGLEPREVIRAGLLYGAGPPAKVAKVAKVYPAAPPSSRQHQLTARMALGFSALLTAWEVSFLKSVVELRSISPKQAATLDRIQDKIDAAVNA